MSELAGVEHDADVSVDHPELPPDGQYQPEGNADSLAITDVPVIHRPPGEPDAEADIDEGTDPIVPGEVVDLGAIACSITTGEAVATEVAPVVHIESGNPVDNKKDDSPADNLTPTSSPAVTKRSETGSPDKEPRATTNATPNTAEKNESPVIPAQPKTARLTVKEPAPEQSPERIEEPQRRDSGNDWQPEIITSPIPRSEPRTRASKLITIPLDYGQQDWTDGADTVEEAVEDYQQLAFERIQDTVGQPTADIPSNEFAAMFDELGIPFTPLININPEPRTLDYISQYDRGDVRGAYNDAIQDKEKLYGIYSTRLNIGFLINNPTYPRRDRIDTAVHECSGHGSQVRHYRYRTNPDGTLSYKPTATGSAFEEIRANWMGSLTAQELFGNEGTKSTEHSPILQQRIPNRFTSVADKPLESVALGGMALDAMIASNPDASNSQLFDLIMCSSMSTNRKRLLRESLPETERAIVETLAGLADDDDASIIAAVVPYLQTVYSGKHGSATTVEVARAVEEIMHDRVVKAA